MLKPLILDLFCGAGLAADGYAEAGFDVFGVDIKYHRQYPYKFSGQDAIDFLTGRFWLHNKGSFSAIHASPPCQAFTRAGRLRDAQGGVPQYDENLLIEVLDILRSDNEDIPWVVENVPGAKEYMPNAVQLCGSSFGLEVQRHRLFSSNIALLGSKCDHTKFPLDEATGKHRPWGVYHVPGDSIPSGGRTARDAAHARQVMGVNRDLSWAQIKEGLPPSYTRYIGEQLLSNIND